LQAIKRVGVLSSFPVDLEMSTDFD